MAEIKTRETGASVADHIEALPNSTRRADAVLLVAMMEKLSGDPPKMWGPDIIGFGRYHYKYESGREGDMPRLAFSPRKAQMVVYLSGGFTSHSALLARLGKFKTGKVCLYITRLADVNLAVLENLVSASLTHMDARYPR